MSGHYAQLSLAAARARYLLNDTQILPTNVELITLFSSLSDYIKAYPTARQTDRPFFATALAAMRMNARVEPKDTATIRCLVDSWVVPLDVHAPEAHTFDMPLEFPMEEDKVSAGENGYALAFPIVHTRHPSLPPIATLVPAPLAVAHQPAARLPAAHLALSIAAKQARPFAYYVRGRIPVNATPVQVLALFNALSDVIRRYPDALHFDETVTRTALAATRILALIINPGPELIEASKQWRLPLDLSKPSSLLFTLDGIPFPTTIKRRNKPLANGYAVNFIEDKDAVNCAAKYSPPVAAPAPPSPIRARRQPIPLFLPDSDSDRGNTPVDHAHEEGSHTIDENE